MAHIQKTGDEVAKMILSIGQKELLVTEDKTTLVGAINEIYRYVSSISRAIAIKTDVMAAGQTQSMIDIEGRPYVARVTEADTGNEVVCDIKYESDAVLVSISKPYEKDLTVCVEYIME